MGPYRLPLRAPTFPPEDCFEVLRQRELVIGTAKGCRAPRAMWLVVPEVFGDISREGRVDLVSGEMIDVVREHLSADREHDAEDLLFGGSGCKASSASAGNTV